MQKIEPKPIEIPVPPDRFLVSKTDTKGIITYANPVFCEIAGYSEEELIGKPHNIVRHPDMPRTIFKLLWDTIQRGEEIFAYVKNLAKDGRYYWVLAHVTPTFDKNGKIIGYTSDRRPVLHREVLTEIIEPLYKELREEESRGGLEAGEKLLMKKLESIGKSYEEFIFTITFKKEDLE
ncbi:MAG: PAS domain-containing protein [Sulfurihydrogenibium sp.]|uniref:PAS domain-containing protein n=1 Tax=Sulfurihydrogenibium sp. TaxID=2053621 RepID=UPI003D0A67C6